MEDHIRNKMLLIIDTQNLFYSVRDLYGQESRLDFLKLREIACRKVKCDFVHPIVYLSMFKEELSELQNFLIISGFEVRIKKMDIAAKGDMDSQIIVDTMGNYQEYNAIVLCSGDSDFIPLMKKMKAEGKEIGMLAIESTSSKKLEECVDWVIHLDKRILMNTTKEKQI